MKAIGYIRVSTEGQAQEGVSLEAQESKIRSWCDASGFELAGIYVEALSGGRADNRPELQRALAEVCRAKGVLVVYSLSRLARSTTDAIAISQRLEKCGADLASLTERIDTTTAAGKMVFRMLAVLAEFERDQIKERTVAAMNHLRQKNLRISRVVPFGYDLAEGGQILRPNASEQANVALMARLRAGGASYAAIASELTARGVRTKAGGTWDHSAVRKILLRAEKAGSVSMAA